MFDKARIRFISMIVLCVLVACVFTGRLYAMQVRDGADYLQKTQRTILRTTSIPAPRGEILDRFGRPLVENRRCFTLIVDKVSLGSADLNQVILDLIDLLREHGESFTDTLPVSYAPYAFTDYNEDGSESKRITSFKEKLKLEAGASADEVMAAAKKRYKIPEIFSENDARDVISVRFEMENRDFSTTYPFTIAQDVSMETVTRVKEQQHIFTGIEVSEDTVREYPEGTTAAHILGRVGAIYKEEYEELKEKGYKLNDQVGKDGAEKAFEDYLRGTDGTRAVEQNILGKVLDVKASVEPEPGNNVLLTLDMSLQKVAEESLARNIQSIADRNQARKTSGWDAQSGAVVVLDVKNSGVLAMASHPTFSLKDFGKNATALYADPTKPTFNRALAGAYEPGSTFKMLTAIAGLESGVIDPKTTIVPCTGVYQYYAPSYTPHCWVYDDYGSTHGRLNVVGALEKSCNIFFYETGRLMGITTLDAFAKKFGLGEYTGIELSGESKGSIASPENAEKRGEIWYDGLTLQAAIGQSGNLLTPLQLANYVATIANGGVHNPVHLLSEVRDYTMSETVSTYEVKGEDLNLNPDNIKTVIEGMKKVTEDGTASSVFRNYPISVAGKTGTAQVPTGSSNGVFVAFAPVEDPEIAIAIVIEHGAHGNWCAPIAKDIMDEYFKADLDPTNDDPSYTPLP